MPNELNRVWITGVAGVTPLGEEYAEIAAALLAGRSGVRRVSRFDISNHPSQIAGQFDRLACPAGCAAEEFDGLDRLDQIVLSCSIRALRDAGYWDQRSALRVGLVLGLGNEWFELWESDTLRGGARVFTPERDRESLVHTTRRRLGLSGPALAISAACASGNHAIALARRWLRLGWVDACLAGACDAGVSPLSMAGFGNLRALSRRNDDPEAASRPFDRDREGFVMGEGGAVFLLERPETARRRGARVYAEVAGCGASSDAYHMVIPSPDPEPPAMAVRRALADARLAPSEINYINAHGTSTPVGDVGEARVLRAVLGEYHRDVPVSSTKSMTGHLLAAAAAVEALACIIAIEHQAVPPTINLDHPDPECDLCHVPHQARPQPIRWAVSNSFGFGGSNTCLVLKAA